MERGFLLDTVSILRQETNSILCVCGEGEVKKMFDDDFIWVYKVQRTAFIEWSISHRV